MMLKTLLMVFVVLIFSGCGECAKVPVPCVVPEPKEESCSLKGLNDIEVVAKLVECIYSYQDAAEVCK